MMLVKIGGKILNLDHVVSVEGAARPFANRRVNASLTTGKTITIDENNLLTFEDILGTVVPAPPGMTLIEAFIPTKDRPGSRVVYWETTLVAFRIMGGAQSPVPVGLRGEVQDQNGFEYVVVQTDGRCVGSERIWSSRAEFFEYCDDLAEIETEEPEGTVLPPGDQLQRDPVSLTVEPESLTKLRALILAAPIEALRPGAPWRPGRDFAEVIAEVRDANPQLHVSGVGYQPSFGWKWQPGRMDSERAAMTSPGHVAEFECAIRFLSYAARDHRTRSVNERRSSYSWKHVAENVLGPDLSKGYVQNGMLIAAAYALGFTVRTVADSPNVYINLAEAAAALDPNNGI